jgi:hypothetical protein
MLYVTLYNDEDSYYHTACHLGEQITGVDELFTKRCDAHVEVQADGDELFAILMDSRNFPVTTEDVQWWNGDLARMIIMNWNKYWHRTTKQDLHNFLG